MRIRALLRLGFGNRRTADCWNCNSVENGAHRRKAPVPVRVCFAGADASAKFVPPTRTCSWEDRVCPRAQLRLGSGNRRKMDTEEPTSVEKDAHRRKAPVPVRVCFAGADARWRSCPPGSRCSTEDSIRFRVHLRPTFACRRKMNTEEPSSVERGAHRRKAPVPVRSCFAGAEASLNFSPPTRLYSSEDCIGSRDQLRLGAGNRRTPSHWHPTSGGPGLGVCAKVF